MSVWRDETDFLRDIESISEFYTSGHHNEPSKKFVFKSKKVQSPAKSSLWYESDSDEENNYGCGRGRINGNDLNKPGKEVDHLDVLRNIQMEVRSVVGNRYNNDVLESFYNVCKEENADVLCDAPSIAPKEISISYAKEQQNKRISPVEEQGKKCSVADRIENSAANFASPVAGSSGSASSSPKKENRHPNRRHFKRPQDHPKQGNSRSSFPNRPFCTQNNGFNVKSKQDFPPLS